MTFALHAGAFRKFAARDYRREAHQRLAGALVPGHQAGSERPFLAGVGRCTSDKTETVWGMDIIINTTAKTDAEAKALLKGFQFPFVN